jgi:hypothetical protein
MRKEKNVDKFIQPIFQSKARLKTGCNPKHQLSISQYGNVSFALPLYVQLPAELIED